MTIATNISARYHDDGLTWRDQDEIHLGDALIAAGATRLRTTERGSDVWVLPDGSAIATTESAWDVVVHYDDLPAQHDDDCDGEAWCSASCAPGCGWIFRLR